MHGAQPARADLSNGVGAVFAPSVPPGMRLVGCRAAAKRHGCVGPSCDLA
jgi:hypothetical protein